MSAGALQLVAGSASVRLAATMGEAVGVEPAARELERFPDGEIHVRLHDELREDDVYLVQSTGPPTQEHLTELFLLADAAHRAGAARITAVVPYLAYARQDRRTATGEPVGLRVVAELLRGSHVDRLVVVDPHTPALESIVSVPVETTTAVPLLAAAVREHTDARAGADPDTAQAVLSPPTSAPRSSWNATPPSSATRSPSCARPVSRATRSQPAPWSGTSPAGAPSSSTT